MELIETKMEELQLLCMQHKVEKVCPFGSAPTGQFTLQEAI